MQDGGHSARQVFEILVREHADMLVAYLRSLLGREPAVDDLFQEVMLVAWRRLPEYDRSRPFAPWLRGIARMLVLEHHRKGRARPLSTDPVVLAELDLRFDAIGAKPGDTFLERTSTLADCLAKLPETMRHAVELVYSRDQSLAAAAAAIGETKDAVMKRVQRARQALARCMRLSEAHD